MTLEKLRGRLLVSLLLGAVVFVGVSIYADFNAVIEGLSDFNWLYLPVVLGLTCLNYVLRFGKWQFYLKTIGVRDLPVTESALVYFAGLGMVVTPGKVGEWLKCYLLRELHGTSFTRTAPIVIAERLTDCLGLVILGAAGLVVFRDAWPAFVIVIVGGAAMFVLVRHQPLAYWVLHRLERVPVVSKVAHHAEEFYVSSYALLSPFAMLSMTLLSVISWGFEVIAFYVVLLGLGVHGGGDVLLRASFIMPAATLASALAMTPGGLGVAEGGITGLSQVLLDLPRSTAAVGALVIRFCTLWFGVFVGLIALAIVSRLLSKRKHRDIDLLDVDASQIEEAAPGS